MPQQSLMLGETCLDNYVSPIIKLDINRKKEIDELITKIEERGALNVEKYPLQLLKNESKLLYLNSEYRRLDPSFLSMSNTVNYKGHEIQLPKFSLHKRSCEGFENFFTQITTRNLDNLVYTEDRYWEFSFNNSISPMLIHQIIKSFKEFYENSTGKIKVEESHGNRFFGLEYGNLGKEIVDKYRGIVGISKDTPLPPLSCITFTTQFNGILPQETFEKIKEADNIFEDETKLFPEPELYLIKETRSEEWNIATRIIRCPLIVGVYDDKCFLVDHFNTTPIENYVSKEFTF